MNRLLSHMHLPQQVVYLNTSVGIISVVVEQSGHLLYGTGDSLIPHAMINRLNQKVESRIIN